MSYPGRRSVCWYAVQDRNLHQIMKIIDVDQELTPCSSYPRAGMPVVRCLWVRASTLSAVPPPAKGQLAQEFPIHNSASGMPYRGWVWPCYINCEWEYSEVGWLVKFGRLTQDIWGATQSSTFAFPLYGHRPKHTRFRRLGGMFFADKLKCVTLLLRVMESIKWQSTWGASQ